MELITSHSNADFDSFAGMLAARKLHPQASIVFSGSLERALATFLDNPYYQFPTLGASEIRDAEVTRLILVDVNHSSRIGALSRFIGKPTVEVIVYDHHGEEPSDITGARKTIRAVGAVTTMLVGMLRHADIPVSKIEATIFALGIYEDTGMLAGRTTTPEDLRTAAWLIENGADLGVITKYLRSDLNPEQMALLNELVGNAHTQAVKGLPINIATATRDEYVPDAAAVVHKLMEVHRYPTLIALIRMGDRIHVIGRSRQERLDLGAVFAHLGGGGHAPAAYAMIAGQTLVEVQERIVALLEELVPSAVLVRDIMTRDLFTLPAETSLTRARTEMVRLNVNTIPVTDGVGVIGIVTRQQLSRALEHRLRGTLRDVMTPEFPLLPPDAGIESAEQLIMEGTQRAVLVGENPSAVTGIVTRMDLFRRLYLEKRDHELAGSVEFEHRRTRQFDIIEMVRKRLDPAVGIILEEASRTAAELGIGAYLVGGIVRDLILDYANSDVDLVVIGDGIVFAEALAARLGGYVHAHHQFGTAVIVLPDGTHVDVVSARRESYDFPGALPRVESGSLRADLYRRDFTINALAINLESRHFGQLVDYFGGMRDIQNRKIRILHGLSFIDDPTRMLRAVRFSVRLNFDLTDGTRAALEAAVRKNMLWRVSGKRLQHEMEGLLEGPRPVATIDLLSRLGLLQALHRKLTLDRFTMELLQKIDDSSRWFRITFPREPLRCTLLFYMALFEKLTLGERRTLCRKLVLTARETKIIATYKRLVKQAVHLYRDGKELKYSRIVRLLEPFSLETILYTHAFARSEKLRGAITRYLTDLRHVKPSITGAVLKQMDIPPGPRYREILNLLRRARLDGVVRNRVEEIAWVRRYLDRHPS